MSIITLNGISHYFGDQCVLKDVSFGIDRDKQIGFIGRNGSGKTTLLNIISGKIIPREGTVNRMRSCRISYLSQAMPVNSEQPMLEFVISSHKRLRELSHYIRDLEQKIVTNPSAVNLQKLSKYQEEFLALDGYTLEHRAKVILQKLGFSEESRNRAVNSFSGGEKTRLELAAILLQPADLMLLDEPTNHLDLKMRDWLMKYLKELNISYIIVSHDRYFLDKTTNMTLSLENKGIVTYAGSYTLFEKEYRERQEQLRKQYQSQQEWIAETEEFIRRNIAGQKTKQAKSRLKALERLKKIAPVKEEKDIKLFFEPKKRSGNIVFDFDNVEFGYPGKILAGNINGNILYQDRIAILGDNGCGKTTLLQMLLGEKEPLKGKLQRGASLSIGYYDQLHLTLNGSLTVRETINSEHNQWTNHQTLSYLAKFGFTGDETEKMVSLLSGGEKARLYLSLLIARRPNVLIMDEPTNHLDIFLIESLEKALDDYEGTLIFVSHDRFFIENIAERFWVFQNRTIVETNDWEKLLFRQEEKPAKQSRQKTPETSKEKRVNPILLDIKLKQIDKIRDTIGKRENELNDLEMQYLEKEVLRDPQRVKLLHSRINQLREEIKNLNEEVAGLEEEYLVSLYRE